MMQQPERRLRPTLSAFARSLTHHFLAKNQESSNSSAHTHTLTRTALSKHPSATFRLLQFSTHSRFTASQPLSFFLLLFSNHHL